MNKKKQDKFLALYEPVHASFERFCRARVYGDMDYRDLINETLLKAFQNFESLRSEKAFLSFLFTISVRILSNNNRKQKESATNFEAEESQILDVNSNTEVSTEIYLLHKALAGLPDEQRESIILYEISGFNIKEIAEIQNASETAVKQRLRRGRLKLKEILSFVAINTTEKAHE